MITAYCMNSRGKKFKKVFYGAAEFRDWAIKIRKSYEVLMVDGYACSDPLDNEWLTCYNLLPTMDHIRSFYCHVFENLEKLKLKKEQALSIFDDLD